MATYAIGDIHGCLNALEHLVDRLALSDGDTLVLLGDYVDRGPHSCGVIDWALDYSGPAELVTLRGNHEVMMLDARENVDRFFSWQHFGGEETLLSYGWDGGSDWIHCVPDTHWEFLENATPYFAEDNFILVHASVKRKVPLDEQDDRALYWKKLTRPKAYSREHLVVCGHTTQYDGEIADFGHTILIDTYAYGDGWLTCLNVDTLAYWQASELGETRSGELPARDLTT